VKDYSKINRRHARGLRRRQTDAERRLWHALRNRALERRKFRRQHPIGNYIVDLVCLDAKLVIELDGGQHLEQATYDQRRQVYLELRGFRVLRFWDDEVLKDLQPVLEVIDRALRATPHPSPLPTDDAGRGNQNM
jgi:very-short-patch-repair endonuclease